MAERIGDAFVKIHADGDDFGKSVHKVFDDAGPEFEDGGERSGGRFSDGFTDELRERLAEFTKRQMSALKGSITRISNIASKGLGSIGDEFEKANVHIEATKELLVDLAVEIDVGTAAAEHFGEVMEDNDEKVTRSGKSLTKFRSVLDKTNDGVDTFADRMGSAFGRGKRNDFVNLIGSVMRGMLRLLALPTRIATGFLDMGTKISETFTKAGGGVSGLASVLGLAAGGLAAFGAAAAAVVIVLGPLIAMVSLLAGTVVALAGTIAFALVGAIGAVAALVAPFAAAVATVSIAIAGLDKESKKLLKVKLKPLIDEFKALGEAAGEGLFANAAAQAQGFAGVLRGMRPLLRNMGGAVSDVADNWIKMMQGPGFVAFRNAMVTFLPNAIRSLGAIMGNVFGGLGGIFRGMVPFMERVLEWLTDITGKFNEWANSARGQKDIQSFFDKAADSAEALGGFLLEVLGLIGDLLGAGKGTGDSIFVSMTDAVAGWREELAKNPDMLKDWFEDAEEFAKALGRAGVAIGKVIDWFDSPQNRAAITGFFDLIGSSADLIKWNLEHGLLATVTRIPGAVGKIKDKFIEVKNFITTFDPGKIDMSNIFTFPNLAKIAANIHPLGRMVSIALAHRVKLLDMFNFPNLIQMAGRFARLAVVTMTAIGRGSLKLLQMFTFPNIIDMAGRFARLATTTMTKIGRGAVKLLQMFTFPTMIEMANRFATLAARVATKIGVGTVDLIKMFKIPSINDIASQFAGLSTAILNEIGTIDIGPLFKASGKLAQFALKGGSLLPGPLAEGGMFDSAQVRLIAEAGPEAVVPLDRPLAQVDPAVRWLSAIAQGKAVVGPGAGAGGKTVNVGGITVLSPSADPRVVAVETVNHLVAVGY